MPLLRELRVSESTDRLWRTANLGAILHFLWKGKVRAAQAVIGS